MFFIRINAQNHNYGAWVVLIGIATGGGRGGWRSWWMIVVDNAVSGGGGGG